MVFQVLFSFNCSWLCSFESKPFSLHQGCWYFICYSPFVRWWHLQISKLHVCFSISWVSIFQSHILIVSMLIMCWDIWKGTLDKGSYFDLLTPSNLKVLSILAKVHALTLDTVWCIFASFWGILLFLETWRNKLPYLAPQSKLNIEQWPCFLVESLRFII